MFAWPAFQFPGWFTKLVLIAFGLAAPIACYTMHVWPFLAAGLLTLAITWLTVSCQSIKTALNNPIEALRYE